MGDFPVFPFPLKSPNLCSVPRYGLDKGVSPALLWLLQQRCQGTNLYLELGTEAGINSKGACFVCLFGLLVTQVPLSSEMMPLPHFTAAPQQCPAQAWALLSWLSIKCQPRWRWRISCASPKDYLGRYKSIPLVSARLCIWI